MRTLTLLFCALIAAFVAMPALATECANVGAPGVAPDDTGYGNATACGDSAVALGAESTALGVSASSTGSASTALGRSSSSTGNSSIALGRSAASGGSNSAALGHAASSAGANSVALGFFSDSEGTYSVALGYDASSGGGNSTALGREASAANFQSTAVGYLASSTGDYSTALGQLASAAGLRSTALGDSTTSAGIRGTAVGSFANAGGDFSIALGYVAFATASEATAAGYGATSAGTRSTALGYGASADASSSTALGALAYASQPNSVVLGSIAGVHSATASANVGIGTSAPIEAVDVERSAAAARFQLTSFTSTANEAPQYIQRRARGTTAAPTAVQNNDNLGLFSFRGYNGTSMGGSRATITAQAAGNFTGASTPTRLIFATTPVGQTTPQSVLVITPDGKVQVNGVNLNVPDYVFEDDYALMPPNELKDFIDKNGHLPGIASAQQVNEEGLDLAGTQMNQLQKIEELTLYMLQQEGRLAEQESTLEAQQKLIESLQEHSVKGNTDIQPSMPGPSSASIDSMQALETRNRELEARMAHMENRLQGLLPQVTQN